MNDAERLLVLGTANAHKGAELAALLAPHGFLVRTLADCGPIHVVEEDGDTFAANARKKAVEQARRLGQWVLADDSGIEVDRLGGRPGVFSARYAGVGATDEQNNQRLLAELVDVPLAQRGAQYACHVALADPGGAVRAESSGACRGRLLFEPRGANGFGYDPLFEVIELHETFGRLGPAVKQALSHRARALRGILPPMKRLAESGAWGRVESFVG